MGSGALGVRVELRQAVADEAAQVHGAHRRLELQVQERTVLRFKGVIQPLEVQVELRQFGGEVAADGGQPEPIAGREVQSRRVGGTKVLDSSRSHNQERCSRFTL